MKGQKAFIYGLRLLLVSILFLGMVGVILPASRAGLL